MLTSPATRAKDTARRVLGDGVAIDEVRAIYEATPGTLIDELDSAADAERVLLVGHNPGLEDLVLMLVPQTETGFRDEVEIKYPTATLAEPADPVGITVVPSSR